ncbi:sentrin-specific protease 7 isoform X3 [Sceloporus undulatus]|uniref:sentrin-specific protease 7 isoform X3 n=1 Tax=Sceloporus undulatus TaxID=8520 RepID=UPI001C4B8090|nr:sentrin-specific protease 7 isoform X3 [Sceloporus undulatus]
MEGCEKKSSLFLQNYRIPKKVGDTKSDDVYVQSPLSRLSDGHQWDHPLQGWTSRSRRSSFPNWKRKRHSEKYCFSDEESRYGQPKVILTNILKTEVGRKYTKTQLITDANLSHGVKLQSDQQTSSSVDTVEIWQILSPLHESLFISKRQPKVILTNVLRTKTGRQYMQRHLLTDANLADANKLQSDEQASSPIATLESCQKISSQQRRILSKRYGRYRRKPNDQNQSKDAESNNALLSLRRCDVVLEDCSIKNKGDWPVKGRRDPKSPCLREATFQNSESRKRRGSTFPNQQNAYSPQKFPLPSKEERRESIQSSVCMDLNKNHMNSFQQEDNPHPVELDSTEKFTTINQDTLVNCPKENFSNSSPCRSQHSVIRKDKEVSPLTTSPRKKKLNISLPPEEPLNEPERHKETIESAEPIVVSSDEEGTAEAKEPKKYFQTGKSHLLMKKESEQVSELPLSEELSESVTEGKTEQVSDEPLKLQPSTDCSTFSELVDLVLDIKFENLFIGKYKGRATHCARFTTGYIKIPFEVILNKKMELSVDLLHLRRFGLWTNSHLGSNVIIFLWLSSDYVEQIEKEIGTSILNKQAKNTEFIFITRSQPLTEEEQIILKKIIVEVSKKNSFPELTECIPWEQAIKEIPREENSFMNYCYPSFQQQLQKDILTEQPHQESKAILTKPNYTLLQKQNSGLYSFSISCTEMNRWKELQENGPVKNLIVYPPPPAKGGLGVTREDLECLEYGEFLNDVIIDFYLKYLLLEKAPKELADRSHIFSSFFYKCLTRTEKNSEENPSLSIAQRRHRRVKRWTRYVNIFNKDYIFVPVNEESHWYIAIICFPWLEEVIYEDSPDQCLLQSNFHRIPHQTEIKNIQPATVSPGLDSSMSKSFSSNSKIKKVCKRPCILILDSLKASSSRNTVQVLREYLEAEWEANCKTCREFSKSVMVDFCPRVPKQDNNSDCGVYLLQYVETFFQSPIVNFEFPMHLERWFPRQVVRSKREEIRDLILQLHLQQQSGSKS